MQQEKEYIAAHLQDDVRELALKLKAKPSGLDVSFILRQIAGRQSVRNKLPDWYRNEDVFYPEHLSLEQCSSQLTAQYKASLCKGDSFADLTGGFGVDCAAMAARYKKAIYVERQEDLCRLASHNFSVLGLHAVEVVQAEAEEYLSAMQAVDFIYLDPARRNKKGEKTVFLSDCSPDVSVLKDQLLQKAATVLIKLSPMLDISLALRSLPETREVHVVSVENECKELLFLLDKETREDVTIHAVNLSDKKEMAPFVFQRKEEQSLQIAYTGELGAYLYEPNTSLLKAGAYKMPAQAYSLEKLHPDSHLYTSKEVVPSFPGRIFRIDNAFSLNKKDRKKHLSGLSQANITVRNFPLSVEAIRKQTGLKPGGDVYLFATTLGGGERIIIETRKL